MPSDEDAKENLETQTETAASTCAHFPQLISPRDRFFTELGCSLVSLSDIIQLNYFSGDFLPSFTRDPLCLWPAIESALNSINHTGLDAAATERIPGLPHIAVNRGIWIFGGLWSWTMRGNLNCPHRLYPEQAAS